MTKRLSLLLAVCLLLTFTAMAQKKAEWVYLKGELKNFSNQVQIEDLSEFQYLLPPTTDRIIVPDAQQRFDIKFKLAAPNYFRLGRNILYLSPGDDMEVSVDYSNNTASTFKGKGAAANEYLRNTPFPKGGSFIEGGKNIKETPEATIAAVEALAEARTKELAAIKNISPEFRRLENARVKADLINSLYSGENYGTYMLRLKDEKAKAYTESYMKAIAPKVAIYSKNFVDASLMKLVVYRDIADELVKQGGKSSDVQQIKDWYGAYSLIREMQKESDKSKLNDFKPKLAAVKTPGYRIASTQMLSRLMAFGKGDTPIDFVAKDIEGKRVSLSSLKGKVIYIDLWAIWCGPCMEEMPHFEKLKDKYKDNPEIAFVSLSIDDTEAPWKASVAQRKASGLQWNINRNKLQAYNIVGIPRILLIGKDFKMADMNAALPSDAKAITAIEKLLN
uniref:TlpA family protein disulfide reductase n=1 Tax=Pedobacter schmidteae TaxID=2201271 RepID=UPI000EB4D1B8|nr:TlpA disulfide reductase family protein [Pedobacter schmidteae]